MGAYKGGTLDDLRMLVQSAHASGFSDNYANVRMFPGHGNDSKTPLMKAASQGRPDSVRALLALRADPRLKDDCGRTALEIAEETNNSRSGCADVVTVLRLEMTAGK